MLNTIPLVVLAGFFQTVLSSPTPTKPNHSAIVVPISKRSDYDGEGTSGIAALQAEIAHLKTKYDSIDGISTSGLGRRANTGKEALTPNYPYAWAGPISVGTPAQTMNMDFDTVC
jgi:hypothetical protein